jgi:hypothetical protein
MLTICFSKGDGERLANDLAANPYSVCRSTSLLAVLQDSMRHVVTTKKDSTDWGEGGVPQGFTRLLTQ